MIRMGSILPRSAVTVVQDLGHVRISRQRRAFGDESHDANASADLPPRLFRAWPESWTADMGLRTWPLRSRGWRGVGEFRLDFVVQWAVHVDQALRCLSRALEQVPVRTQARELQVAEPRLPRAEQLALAADLEVLLGEREPVVGRNQRLQPLDRRVRQLFTRTRDQQTVRLL